ncbi:gas vesicle protein [Nocardioides sp. IC4_145]|nr:gas vesicle protein GvpJ [Nocardioides sp. IC4_145]NHC23623.1 gas vesicle protein [Nocardioides sp. IC4_145]
MSGGYLERPAPSGLADVVEMVLDKGVVVDAYARVSLLGIELLTLDARVVIASVDTYLRFAEATHRLDLLESAPTQLPDLVEEGTGALIENVAGSVVEHKVGGVKETVGDVKDTVVGTVKEGVEDAVGGIARRVRDSTGRDDE